MFQIKKWHKTLGRKASAGIEKPLHIQMLFLNQDLLDIVIRHYKKVQTFVVECCCDKASCIATLACSPHTLKVQLCISDDTILYN